MPTSMLQHPALSAAILLIGSSLFMAFAWYGPLRLDYLWAALCMVGAAYFIFRA